MPCSSLDNPGGWSNYTYHSKIAGVGGHGDYIKHEMPAGARPVPMNEKSGKRTSGDWDFFYNGWQQNDPNPKFVRQGASKECVFPDNYRTKLDGPLLKKMGLTRERMEEGDALFFHQLLVPFVEPSRSGIPDDPRRAFYTDVAKYTNTYAFGMRECSEDYGHPFHPCLVEELVNWDGIVTRNLNNYVGNNWRREHTNQYDPLIATTMSLTRWLDFLICAVSTENNRS